jgi:hypothetical protein
MYDLPGFIWVIEIAAVIGVIAGLCAVLYRGAIDAGLGRPAAQLIAAGTGGLLGAWLLAASSLAEAHVFRQEPGETVPWIGVAAAGSLAVYLLATGLQAVSATLAAPSMPARLATLQSFRVVGVVFLILWVLGDLPALFALPAGLGDVAIGLAAPFVASRLARSPERRTSAIWFNLLGLFDLVVAVGLGFLAAPGPLRAFDVTPSTEALSLLPLVLIPTVAVPLAVALHVVSLRRLTSPISAANEPAALPLRG